MSISLDMKYEQRIQHNIFHCKLNEYIINSGRRKVGSTIYRLNERFQSDCHKSAVTIFSRKEKMKMFAMIECDS